MITVGPGGWANTLDSCLYRVYVEHNKCTWRPLLGGALGLALSQRPGWTHPSNCRLGWALALHLRGLGEKLGPDLPSPRELLPAVLCGSFPLHSGLVGTQRQGGGCVCGSSQAHPGLLMGFQLLQASVRPRHFLGSLACLPSIHKAVFF